jgi:hypothetical protein
MGALHVVHDDITTLPFPPVGAHCAQKHPT